MEDSHLVDLIGQKLLLSFDGFEPSAEMRAALESHPVGGVSLYRSLNVQDPAQVRSLTGALQRLATQKGYPPLLIAADQEGGQFMAVGAGVTPFPGNMALGAAGSQELAHRAGEAVGRELAAMGINVNYAPVCDVLADAHNPSVGVRSFGGNPTQVACLGAALIKGLQSAGVAAVAKHFPGMGDATVDSHIALPQMPHDIERLNRVELPPFVAAVQAGVKLVMVGHMILPAIDELPALFSSATLNGLLRQKLGFNGVILSDALDMGPIQQGSGFVIDAIAAAVAGVDLLLFGPANRGHSAVMAGLTQAVKRGLVNTGQLEASAGRVLQLKRWLGGDGTRSALEQPPLEVVGCAEHRALALEIARQAVTLVRDTARRLPLRLQPDERLLVVLPRPADLTPADTSSYIDLSLVETIRTYHAATDEIVIPIDPTHAEISAVRERATGYAQVILGTLNALDHRGQAALANRLLEDGVPTVIVALRAPFDLVAFPFAPAYVCTYSIQPPALQALVEALWGQIPWRGSLPVQIPGVVP